MNCAHAATYKNVLLPQLTSLTHVNRLKIYYTPQLIDISLPRLEEVIISCIGGGAIAATGMPDISEPLF